MPKSKKPRNKKYKSNIAPKKKSRLNVHKAFKKLQSDMKLSEDAKRVKEKLLGRHKSLESQLIDAQRLKDKIENPPHLEDGTLDMDKLHDYIKDLISTEVLDSSEETDVMAEFQRVENALKANMRHSNNESHEHSEILNYQYLLTQLNQIENNLQIFCDNFDVDENYQIFMENVVVTQNKIEVVCVKAFGSSKAADKIIESVIYFLSWMEKDAIKIFVTLTNYSIGKFYVILCNQLYTFITLTYNQHLLLAIDIQNKHEIAYSLFTGESNFDNPMLGNERLKEIYTWIFRNIPEQQQLLKDFQSMDYLELMDLKTFCLNNSKEFEIRIPWLNTLLNLPPFDCDYNKRDLVECIVIYKRNYNAQIDVINRIDSILKRSANCINWIHNFNFTFAKKAKLYFQNQPGEKVSFKKNINSTELLYLKNSLIPSYLESVKDLKAFGILNNSAAPYAIPMAKSILENCKTIIDSLHQIKKSNDLELQTLTDHVKYSVVGMYDEISSLIKRINKDEHHWTLELCRVVNDISISIPGMNKSDKEDIVNFMNQVKPFLNDYKEVYKLRSSDKVFKDIQLCINSIDGSMLKMESWPNTYKI